MQRGGGRSIAGGTLLGMRRPPPPTYLLFALHPAVWLWLVAIAPFSPPFLDDSLCLLLMLTGELLWPVALLHVLPRRHLPSRPHGDTAVVETISGFVVETTRAEQQQGWRDHGARAMGAAWLGLFLPTGVAVALVWLVTAEPLAALLCALPTLGIATGTLGLIPGAIATWLGVSFRSPAQRLVLDGHVLSDGTRRVLLDGPPPLSRQGHRLTVHTEQGPVHLDGPDDRLQWVAERLGTVRALPGEVDEVPEPLRDLADADAEDAHQLRSRSTATPS